MRTIKLFFVLAPLVLISCHGAAVSPSAPAPVGLQSRGVSPDIVQKGDGSQFVIADPISCCVTSMIAGPNAKVWYSDTPDNLIGRIDMAHRATTFSLDPGISAEYIVVGPGDLLWVTTAGVSLPAAILRVTLSGGMSTFHARCATGSYNNAVDGPDGNLWVGVEAQMVLRMTLNGDPTCFRTTGFTETVAAGPDGNVWFTERTGTGTLIGKITPQGTVTEYPDPNVCSNSLIGAGDGFLYGGCSTGLVRIAPPDGHETLVSSVQPYSNLATSGKGDNAVLYYSVLPNHLKIRHLATGKVDDDDLPSGQHFPSRMAFGPDGNLWYYVDSGIGVDVFRIITASPLSLNLAVGETQSLTGSEANHSPSSLFAVSLSKPIASVADGQSPGEFNVTGKAKGSTRIRISDRLHNHVYVSVRVH
jgi:streptogramin lyase